MPHGNKVIGTNQRKEHHSNMATIEQLMESARAAARDGKPEEAQQLFMQVVEADEKNELAWLELSNLVPDPADKQVCLENVLTINPAHEQARQALIAIGGTPPSPPAPAPAPKPAPPPPPPPPAPEKKPPSDEPADIRFRCPRCGEVAMETQKKCTSCGSSMFLSNPPSPKPSGLLNLLGTLWIVAGGLLIVLMAASAFLIDGMQSNRQERANFFADKWSFARERVTLEEGQTDVNWAEVNVDDYEPFEFPSSFYAFTDAMLLLTKSPVDSDTRDPEAPPPDPYAVPIETYLLLLLPAFFLGIPAIIIGLNLKQRKMWAYGLNILALLVHLGWGVAMFTMGSTLIITLLGLPTEIAPPPEPPRRGAPPPPLSAEEQLAEDIREGFPEEAGMIVLILVGLHAVLTLVSGGDFFGGKKYRFEVRPMPDRDDRELYMRGSFYAKQGFWFAASHEWELATKLDGNNAAYHHALGLASAHLGDTKQAMVELQKAIGMGANAQEIEPIIQQIKEAESGGS